MSKSYNNDPRPIKIRFSTSCKYCGKHLSVNDMAYYWPATRTLKCIECGDADFRAFLSSKCDEEVYAGTGNPYSG